MMSDVINTPKGKKFTRPIKCGYCGEQVSQINARHETGKWFHTECISDYANFYKAVTKLNPSSKGLEFLQTFILKQMIMRKDLRQLHKDWNILSREKAVPLALKQQISPEIIVFG